MKPANRVTTVLRLALLGAVLSAAAAGIVATRRTDPPHPSDPPSRLLRPGRSVDLVCDLDAAHGSAPPRREARMAPACPGAPSDSSARVVPVGDDRRRALVLRANEVFETEITPGDADVLRFWAAVRGLGDELDVRVTLGEGENAQRWERHLATHERWVHGELPIDGAGAATRKLRIETTANRPRDRDARLAFGAPRLLRLPRAEEDGVPNIVLYLIDTLRADHTPMYGYERNTMPRLNDLAGDGVVFDRAYSTAARTRPAAASALTGLYPSRHHARLGRGISFEEDTLAEVLRRNGWSTWAYVANGNVFAPGFAFEQGFDRFHTIRGIRRDNHARTGEINERMLPLVREYADEPFFLYVHAIDPHSPYDPPPAFAGRFQDPAYSGPVTAAKTHSRILGRMSLGPSDVDHVRALYDEDVLYQDAMFGELLDTLEKAGVLDRTLIVVVADHGDEFAEHGGWEHGNRLFEHQTRIPIVVRAPDAATEQIGPRRISTPVSLADVPPTILGLYGLPAPAGTQGRDLSDAILRPTAEPPAESIYVEEATNIPGGDLRSLYDGRWKLIRRSTFAHDDPSTEYELFDLEMDPEEAFDLSAVEPERVAQMREELLRRSRAIGTPLDDTDDAPELDERTRKQLEALGYVTGD